MPTILTSKNTLPATSAMALYNLKVFLVSTGWTVMESGDGLSAYGVDVISSGGSGAGGMANNKAWYRIRMPGGTTRELVVQWLTATTIRIRYCPSGFTGGGGATNVTPAPVVAANAANVIGGGTDASPTGVDLFGTINRVSYWADQSAPYGWGMFGWSTAGATTFGLMLEAMIPGTAPSSDPDPYLMLTYANSANFGVFATYFGLATATNYAWYRYGQSNQAWTTFAGCAPASSNNRTIVGGTYALPSNPWTGKDDLIPIVWAREGSLANPGWKGIGLYAQYSSITRPNLTTQSITTTSDRIVIGNTSFPWGNDGVSPTL